MNSNKLFTIRDLRNQQYDNSYKLYPYLKNWKKNPYTFIKAILYMESSAILVFLLLKTKIKPNSVTILYALCGIFGGVLLSIPLNSTIIIALVIFFLKGILDWSDGHLARVTYQTSITGHVLDVYGAHLNEVGFFLGFGFYVASHSGFPFFIYLVPLYPFLLSVNIITFSRWFILDEISKEKIEDIQLKKKIENSSPELKSRIKLSSLIQKVAFFLKNFLDSRARTIDIICLIILLEMNFPINISWIIFILLLLKYFIVFIGSFYMVVKRNWVNETLNNIALKL